MAALSPAQITEGLKAFPNWQLENGTLVRNFTFADFVAAMGFVNSIADLAEQAGHHPDIDIRYNRVKLGLVSHDAGGITSRDFSLAAQIDKRADAAV
jgi:4a-hydroxytetrahydrobiopterin dehydratase